MFYHKFTIFPINPSCFTQRYDHIERYFSFLYVNGKLNFCHPQSAELHINKNSEIRHLEAGYTKNIRHLMCKPRLTSSEK
jgi:hypothetical protein